MGALGKKIFQTRVIAATFGKFRTCLVETRVEISLGAQYTIFLCIFVLTLYTVLTNLSDACIVCIVIHYRTCWQWNQATCRRTQLLPTRALAAIRRA